MPMARSSLAAVSLWVAAILSHAGAVLLQADPAQRAAAGQRHDGVYLVPLEHERAPVRRGGKVVSHKTTYSGTIHVGSPVPQDFRVVFDTGSAHLVLPATECESAPCAKRRRYNISASTTGQAVKVSGAPVGANELADQVSIGFGSGKVVGEPVSERFCLGPSDAAGACAPIRAIMATSLSGSAFEELQFDGILGLSLSSLALSKDFCAFDALVASEQLAKPYFSVFLASDEARSSELAVGGHNERRALTPFAWVPIVKPELGYWQVEIGSIRVDGKELDLCQDGTCSGILDSGTSHLGLPPSHFGIVDSLLARPARSMGDDCRLADSPTVELQLRGVNLTLYPQDYMRPLPLSKNVMKHTGLPDAEQYCRPKLMPVKWPPPMGPKVFILGEAVLQRYYTAYDWSGPQAGFALANQDETRELQDGGAGAGGAGRVRVTDEIMLVQVTVAVRHRGCKRALAVAQLRAL